MGIISQLIYFFLVLVIGWKGKRFFFFFYFQEKKRVFLFSSERKNKPLEETTPTTLKCLTVTFARAFKYTLIISKGWSRMAWSTNTSLASSFCQQQLSLFHLRMLLCCCQMMPPNYEDLMMDLPPYCVLPELQLHASNPSSQTVLLNQVKNYQFWGVLLPVTSFCHHK